jgi:LytS/YehU family sensor histidine kinase
VGINNVQQRLKLIYLNQHRLEIKEEKEAFKVQLNIEL